ncbi:MAG: nucleotidyltransferase family protein [Bacteroidota bacterium]|nr:nucleotidyltransferase family protein [Bacteroidota bacterium]
MNIKTMDSKFNELENSLNKCCKRYNIKKLSLFGSALRADFSEDSDVDMLIEFIAGKEPGYFGMVTIQEELSNLFGRKIDLKTENELSKYFRKDVLKEAKIEYEEK